MNPGKCCFAVQVEQDTQSNKLHGHLSVHNQPHEGVDQKLHKEWTQLTHENSDWPEEKESLHNG